MKDIFLLTFLCLLTTSLSIPMQAQDQVDAAYEDEYAGLLSRMVEKGYSTTENNGFLGPVSYWQNLWDRVKLTDIWEQMMTNAELKKAQRTESNGSTAMTNVLLTRSDRVAWIAFPGVGEDDEANRKSGTVNNFPIWRGHSDMDVQKYFFDEYEGLKPQITAWMATHKDDFDKVIVTGHSKGGALSQYFLADFLDTYPNKIFHFIAFGSPNGGNENFINYWANKPNLARAQFYTTWGWYAKINSSSKISDIITYNEIDISGFENFFATGTATGETYYPRGLARKVDHYITDYSDKLIRQALKVEGSPFTQYPIWEEYAYVIHDDSRYLTGLKDIYNTHTLESIKPNDFSSPNSTIRLASNTSKCLDNNAYQTVDGNNVHLYSCKTSNAAAQTWKLQGNQIKLVSNPAYCLNVKDAKASEGTNVELFTCRWDQNVKAQQWIYDGRTGLFRYMDDPTYCLSVSDTDTNVQLSSCSEGSDKQQWEIDNASISTQGSAGESINLKLASDPNLCIYPKEGYAKNYIPFSIQTFDANSDQALVFNANGSISIDKRNDRCLDLDSGKTDNNTTIQVVPCTGYGSQQWYYDGFSKALRSRSDYYKCIQGGVDGDLLSLQDCTNSKSQQFVIADAPEIATSTNVVNTGKAINWYGASNWCIDNSGGRATNGNKIQLWTCGAENKNQKWVFSEDFTIRLGEDLSKCLDLESSNISNNTKIQLFGCNGTGAQKWIFEGATKMLHYHDNPAYCLTFNKDVASNGSQIYLYECSLDNMGQQWNMEDNSYMQWTLEPAAEEEIFGTINLTSSPDKCIDLKSGNISNGANIQLWPCNGTIAQTWYVEGDQIRIDGRDNYCLSLKSGDAHNGDDVHIWECKGQDNQAWIFDMTFKLIRSRINANQCLTVINDDIKLATCSYNPTEIASQQWTLAGGYSERVIGSYLRIHLGKDDDKCIDMASASSGADVRVYDCKNGSAAAAQTFYFDGSRIRRADNHLLCLELEGAKTDVGTDIQLGTCTGSIFSQKWMYDGISGRIHSKADPNKCMDFDHASTTNGTNLKLDDCKVHDAQIFDIK